MTGRQERKGNAAAVGGTHKYLGGWRSPGEQGGQKGQHGMWGSAGGTGGGEARPREV